MFLVEESKIELCFEYWIKSTAYILLVSFPIAISLQIYFFSSLSLFCIIVLLVFFSFHTRADGLIHSTSSQLASPVKEVIMLSIFVWQSLGQLFAMAYCRLTLVSFQVRLASPFSILCSEFWCWTLTFATTSKINCFIFFLAPNDIVGIQILGILLEPHKFKVWTAFCAAHIAPDIQLNLFWVRLGSSAFSRSGFTIFVIAFFSFHSSF